MPIPNLKTSRIQVPTDKRPPFPGHVCHHENGRSPIILNGNTRSDIFEPTSFINTSSLKPNGGRCNPRYLIGTCEPGHPIAAYPVFCGKPNCERCGKEGSQAHNRRLRRVWQHLSEDQREWRYFVFTIPKYNQTLMHNVQLLNSAKKFIKRLLINELGVDAGLFVWHYMGDKSPDFFVHLNIIVPGGFVPQSTLTTLRNRWTWWLRRKGGSPYLKVSDIHVSFTADEAKKYHWVKYITRPTLLIGTPDRFEVYNSMLTVTYFGAWRGNVKETEFDSVSDREASDLLRSGKYEELARSRRCVHCSKKLEIIFNNGRRVDIESFLELIPEEIYIKYERGP